MPDKFKALWVSHSSLSEFQKCPRAYYLKNMYKDPKTGHKVKIVSPPLTLGTVVHTVLENLSNLPTDKRFSSSLITEFEKEWTKYTGKKGGFISESEEQEYKKRGEVMIRYVVENPGPLEKLAVKINMDLPFFWLSEDDNIILCGKVDWLEYLPDTDSVNIIDFKTSKSSKEDPESLQLPIYNLLVTNCQNRTVEKASYWYLDNGIGLEEKELPNLEESHQRILLAAKKINVARKLDNLECPNGADGCFACKDMERILKGEGELIGEDDYRADVYILPRKPEEDIEDREGVLL